MSIVIKGDNCIYYQDVRTQVEVVSSQQENRNDDDGGGWQQGRQSPTKSIMKKPGKDNDKTAQQVKHTHTHTHTHTHKYTLAHTRACAVTG